MSEGIIYVRAPYSPRQDEGPAGRGSITSGSHGCVLTFSDLVSSSFGLISVETREGAGIEAKCLILSVIFPQSVCFLFRFLIELCGFFLRFSFYPAFAKTGEFHTRGI